MARYVIQDESTKAIKKLLPKYSSFNIDDERIKGVVEIIGYRKYAWGEEIDIKFTGKVSARMNYSDTPIWYDSSVMTDKGINVSKVKINRLIKKRCFDNVKQRMHYFDVRIHTYSVIKKIKWI